MLGDLVLFIDNAHWNLQTSSTSTTFAPGAVRWNWCDILWKIKQNDSEMVSLA